MLGSTVSNSKNGRSEMDTYF